ncbi:MAG: hypothetical protein MUF54_04390 [Polyangiaceae bacterium]|jgi:SAM-dependent methyltransferase|nr:hypothetical protein [Polyangiaceae bacterium]
MAMFSALQVDQVAIFETFVVPRFLSSFGTLALEMLIPSEGAVVANLGCRTGYPDQELHRLLPNAIVYGFDPSAAAIALARTKSALVPDSTFDYHVAGDIPLRVPDSCCSHAITLCPGIEPARRPGLISEMARLLVTGGQALFALPLRGSYQEVADLLREYALKFDVADIANALDSNLSNRPTAENFGETFEACGLTDVEVDMRLITLPFRSGRDFFEDPMTRLMIVPELQILLDVGELTAPFDYVRDAIDRYWSEEDFELSVNIGCASARRP